MRTKIVGSASTVPVMKSGRGPTTAPSISGRIGLRDTRGADTSALSAKTVSSLWRDDTWLWNVEFCGEQEHFLCNLKNQLCADQYWYYEGDLRWGGDEMCAIRSEADSVS